MTGVINQLISPLTAPSASVSAMQSVAAMDIGAMDHGSDAKRRRRENPAARERIDGGNMVLTSEWRM